MALYIWAIGILAAGQSSTMTGTYAGQFVMEVRDGVLGCWPLDHGEQLGGTTGCLAEGIALHSFRELGMEHCPPGGWQLVGTKEVGWG